MTSDHKGRHGFLQGHPAGSSPGRAFCSEMCGSMFSRRNSDRVVGDVACRMLLVVKYSISRSLTRPEFLDHGRHQQVEGRTCRCRPRVSRAQKMETTLLLSRQACAGRSLPAGRSGRR